MNENQTNRARFPSFFIIGAPRCGTTALSKYLSKNPQICFSKPKEPHFFSILIKKLANVDLQTDYVNRFFSHCDSGVKAIGEGSVSYLYHPEAIETIAGANPAAKFIVMVRNPIEMIYSYHARLLALVEEDEGDFGRAWSLQGERAQGRRLPRHCHDPLLLQYAEVGKMGKQVERLFQLVGRDRCLVLVHDDFVRDTLAIYKQVLAFLGVDYDDRTDFPRMEANKRIRSRWLQHLLKRPPRQYANFVKTMEQQQKRKGRKKTRLMRVRKWLIKKNRVEIERSPLDPGMQQLLKQTYSADIHKLSRLLNRDLSHWG